MARYIAVVTLIANLEIQLVEVSADTGVRSVGTLMNEEPNAQIGRTRLYTLTLSRSTACRLRYVHCAAGGFSSVWILRHIQ